jgi:hypothetical protein
MYLCEKHVLGSQMLVYGRIKNASTLGGRMMIEAVSGVHEEPAQEKLAVSSVTILIYVL